MNGNSVEWGWRWWCWFDIVQLCATKELLFATHPSIWPSLLSVLNKLSGYHCTEIINTVNTHFLSLLVGERKQRKSNSHYSENFGKSFQFSSYSTICLISVWPLPHWLPAVRVLLCYCQCIARLFSAVQAVVFDKLFFERFFLTLKVWTKEPNGDDSQ